MNPNAVIFCHQPGRPSVVDDAFAPEADAAQAAGLRVLLLDHDSAAAGDADRALRRLPPAPAGARILYRGWMLKVPSYAALARAFEARGWAPVTSTDDYSACHHITGWIDALAGLTPRSSVLAHTPPFRADELDALLAECHGPAIVKDYVKSEKHAWHEACFIPDPADCTAARRVIERFVELRGPEIEGGLVLRDFVRLRSIGVHPDSGMPLSSEVRTFWSGTRCLAVGDYWQTTSRRDIPEVARTAATRINRPFYTLDLAECEDGSWIVMEVGDAQVSGLPDDIAPDVLYNALRPDLFKEKAAPVHEEPARQVERPNDFTHAARRRPTEHPGARCPGAVHAPAD